MPMEKKKGSKKNNRPAGIAPRNKQSYAQYVWIRQIYREIDEIKARQDRLEARVSEMSVKVACDVAEFRDRLDKLESRKVYKEESEQSSKANEND